MIVRLTKSIENYIRELETINQERKSSRPPIVGLPANKIVILKVSFRRRKDVWRKIELKTNNTLVDLNDAIQDAIGWDNDHLYSFFMNGKEDYDSEYTCPYEPEGRKTANIKISQLNLQNVKKKCLFI